MKVFKSQKKKKKKKGLGFRLNRFSLQGLKKNVKFRLR